MYETQMDIKPIHQVVRKDNNEIFDVTKNRPKIDWKRYDYDSEGKRISKVYSIDAFI